MLGLNLAREELLGRFRPALTIAWPDRSDEVDDLEGFLLAARKRIVARSEVLADAEGFVPAGQWTEHSRHLLLENLRLEVEALVGGVRPEGLRQAFDGTGDTAPLLELVESGMLIKVRSAGAFLVIPPTHHQDELTAAEFFGAGKSEDVRYPDVAASVLATQITIHKQIAHLTISRPLPEEIGVYRTGSFRGLVGEVLSMLVEFSEAVDQRLLPDWRQKWLGEFGCASRSDFVGGWATTGPRTPRSKPTRERRNPLRKRVPRGSG